MDFGNIVCSGDKLMSAKQDNHILCMDILKAIACICVLVGHMMSGIIKANIEVLVYAICTKEILSTEMRVILRDVIILLLVITMMKISVAISETATYCV